MPRVEFRYSSRTVKVQVSFTHPRGRTFCVFLLYFQSRDPTNKKLNLHFCWSPSPSEIQFCIYLRAILRASFSLMFNVRDRKNCFGILNWKFFTISSTEIIWSPPANLCRSRTSLWQRNTRAIMPRWVHFLNDRRPAWIMACSALGITPRNANCLWGTRWFAVGLFSSATTLQQFTIIRNSSS